MIPRRITSELITLSVFDFKDDLTDKSDAVVNTAFDTVTELLAEEVSGKTVVSGFDRIDVAVDVKNIFAATSVLVGIVLEELKCVVKIFEKTEGTVFLRDIGCLFDI